MKELFSTVAAISTPPGKGGVAIIRISGEDTAAVIGKCFSPMGRRTPSENPRAAIWGRVIKGGVAIDDALCTYFPAPHSYTGEDMAEISCHGGVLITGRVLEAVLSSGAVAALGGEFTRRAFINGKLSLTDAEAIGMLLEAKSDQQLELYSKDSRDALTRSISEIRSDLTSLMSSIYARIDYPDEDLGELSDEECVAIIDLALSKLKRLKESYRTGRAISEGIECSIVGLPNAGKSTLYNALLGDEYAIVTDIAGTTRDLLTRDATLGGVLLHLTDTAGVRSDTYDKVEKIGVERSLNMLDKSELVLALFDANTPLCDEESFLINIIKEKGKQVIALLTKSDCGAPDEEKLAYIKESFGTALTVSAKDEPEATADKLSSIIGRLFLNEEIRIRDDAVISSARQNSAVSVAIERLLCAKDAFLSGLPADISSSDISLALSAISELDGRSVNEEIVKDIFSKFCVGK